MTVAKLAKEYKEVTAIVLFIVGWMFTYFHKRKVDTRNASLDRVNAQLRQLYGPLYAHLHSINAAWNAFVENFWPEHGQAGYFAHGHVTTEEEKERWRHWMTEVFHPANMEVKRLIIDNMDLMEEDTVPQVFLDTLAHVEVYQSVVKQWEKGDFSHHTSILNYPDRELMEVVEETFFKLRQRQQELIHK